MHADRPAAAVCCECGDAVCVSCRNKMFGRNYCDVCASKVEERYLARQEAPRPQVVVHQASAPLGLLPERKSAGLAVFLSFLFPGAGQMYCGRVGRGLLFMFLTMLGFGAFFIPGFALWIAQLFDAASTANRENARYWQQLGYPELPPGP